MSCYRIAPLLVFAACASAPRQSAEPPELVEPVAKTVDPEIERIFEQESLARQERRAFFERRFTQAQAYWRAGQLDESLEACEHALLLVPTDERARRLRQQLRHDLGYRDGTVALIANEAEATYEVRLEEEKLTIQRFLQRAEKAKATGDWGVARRNYERALFMLRSSRFREDSEISALRGGADDDFRNLRREEAAAERAARERATADALREIARQEREDRGG